MSQALCRLESDGAENRVVYLGPFQRGEPNEAREILYKVDQVARVGMELSSVFVFISKVLRHMFSMAAA